VDINRFTEKMQEAIRAAQSMATRLNHQQLDAEHVLAALLEQEGGLAGAILAKTGIATDLLLQRVEQELGRLPKVTGAGGGPADQVYVTGRLNRLFVEAEDEAKRLKDEYVSVEHFLLALTDDKGAAGRILAQMGVTRERLTQAMREVRGSQRVTTPTPETTYQSLERYGRDLTQRRHAKASSIR
jgi:ATP-dependent Clp protease ATP-binding subunit ClpB